MNYYNEFDPKAAAWLRELIAAGHIPPGDVDERSITEVRPHELTPYVQQHFFAGIGGWPLALRLAGWPDNRPVRTGSCPCQPFSIAGQGRGEADERHLWPNFRDLITFGEPTITFGEQVASKDGRDWLAGVRADLEGLGYEVGAADLCAAGVGAPHPRQRLFWMANPQRPKRRAITKGRHDFDRHDFDRQEAASRHGADCEAGRMVLANGAGRDTGRQGAATDGHGRAAESAGGNGVERLADAGPQPAGGVLQRSGEGVGAAGERASNQSGGSSSFGAWDAFDVLPFRDGKFRRVEAGTFPLAHGVSNRVGLLRGYGNAIVPQVAATFIQACEEALTE